MKRQGQPGLGIGEASGQADMFREHGHMEAHRRPLVTEPCALCGEEAAGEAEWDGRIIRVCQDHHEGAWRMVNG